MKERLKKMWLWARKELFNTQMLRWLIVAEFIFWAPCIAGAILAFTINTWFLTICTAYLAFWALPFTPAIPLQLGLAYGLKKAAEAVKRHKAKKSNKQDNSEVEK